MNRRNILSLSAITALALTLPLGSAVGQQKSLKEQLVGTWTLVSYQSTAADGNKTTVFGAQPKGVLMIDASGHYAMVLTDPGRAKWKSNLRTQLTTDEFAAAAKGLVAQYGGWSVDEASKVLTRKVEGALSPNLAGTEQKPTIALSGDELTVTDANSGVTGGRTEAVFRRAK
jgi:Lipocalin-like domain